MQSLISPVDHESRHHYYQHEDGPEGPQEHTSLLRRFPTRRRSTLTPIFVSLMLILLIFGIVIGTYLLMEQDKAWPINLPFEMISREDWGSRPPRWPFEKLNVKPATHVILTHTGTAQCDTITSCQNNIYALQESFQSLPLNKSDIPFNFMISSDGETYEGRGWGFQGEVDPALNMQAICLSAIGNFTVASPSSIQLKEIKAFIDESIRRHKLSPYYILLGRKFLGYPKKLFISVSKWRHWVPNLENS